MSGSLPRCGTSPSAAGWRRRSGGRVHVARPVALPPGAPETQRAALAGTLRMASGGGPLFAIGHGLGGTRLLELAPETPALRGLVAIAAPVSFGGETRAVRALWARSPATWGATPRGLVDRLLTRGLPAAAERAILDGALAPLDPETLAGWRAASRSPAPEPHAALAALARRPDLPVLAVLAPGDGLFPPWQCDPAAFGLRPPGLERLYVTRAEGHSAEYGHLDLVAHPRARAEIDPLIEAWLAARLSAAAPRAPAPPP